MTRWQTKALGDVLKVQNGYAFDSEYFTDVPDGMPIVRIRDLARGFTETYYSGSYAEKFIIEAGDLLIGMDGEFRCYRWPGPPALLNQRVCRLHAFNREIHPSFVFYGINEHLATIEANTGFSTVKHLSSRQIEEIELPVPPLPKQERIVQILDEAEALRRLRAEADQRVSEFIPQLLYDLFSRERVGEAWKRVTVENLAEDREGAIRTGPFGSQLLHSEFTETGIPVLGIDNVVENNFRWTSSRCIPEKKFERFRRFQVFPGDVMVTIMGTVGRCCVAPHDLPVCMSTKHLCVITPDRKRIHPTFLWASLLFDPHVRQQTSAAGGGAIMEGWNSTIIKALKIRVPPLDLQQEFATHVAEIRTLEAAQATNRQRLDDLFQSLLHRAFQGEL